jgi:hypothetical protein
MTDLSEIATVAGKSGLFKVLKPGRSGLVVESIDDKKVKFVTTPNHKVSVLNEISIYTTDKNGAISLDDVLKKINKEFGKDPGVDHKSSNEELMSFIEFLVPNYDKERVYASDVKKLVNWYQIILTEFPEYFTAKPKEKANDETHETKVHSENKPTIAKPKNINKPVKKANTKGVAQKSVKTPVKAGKKSG